MLVGTLTRRYHMGKGPVPAEVIVAAVQTEREASLFYRMMAEMASDSGVRCRLLELADDENSHATTLANLHYEMTGRGVPETTPGSAEGDPNLFDFQSRSQRDVLEFALHNELAAIDLYQTQAERSEDPKVATIFRLLADAEREHAAYLRLQLGRLDESATHDA
jgi:rubrerythrin